MVSSEEMELINRYTRRNFAPEEVYAFTVVLCDNDIDRDLERFSTASLQKLSELFLGRTGIFNHDPDAHQQAARIFACKVEEVPGKLTAAGDPYCRLTARAYLPRGGSNEDLILQLESGIQKEVSVGCAVKKQVCSICGADLHRAPCSHRKGVFYEGKQCVTILDEPSDAYEWSFVAVPAQREAGVIKSFSGKEELMETANFMWKDPQVISEKFLGIEKDMRLSKDDCIRLGHHLEKLEKEAEAGRAYKKQLSSRVQKLGCLAIPELEQELLGRMTEHLELSELEALEKAFLQKAEEKIPLHPQLEPLFEKNEEIHGKINPQDPYRI